MRYIDCGLKIGANRIQFRNPHHHDHPQSAIRSVCSEMGGRQAAAAAAIAALLPAPRSTATSSRFSAAAPSSSTCYGAGRLRGHRVVLIDSNADLIGCYETVRDAPEMWQVSSIAWPRRTREAAARSITPCATGSSTRSAIGCGAPTASIAYTPALAAMLIYLNRTGFNGLFRLNARGAFNVPAGRYDRPNIVDRGRLARVADALSGARAASGLRVVRRRARSRGAGRFRLLRSALCAAQPNGQLHVIHGAALRRRGSAAIAAGGDRTGAPRMPRAPQQLDRRRNCRALREERRGQARRAARAAGAGATRDQQQRRTPRRRRRVSDYEC